MKKLAIIASLVAAFGSVTMAQAGSTGTITFNGELTANTCDVIVDGQSNDATVVLPTVSTNQLQTAATTTGDTGFVIALTNCSGALQTASAFFQMGASVNADTGRLINMTGTAGDKVSLQLLDGTSSKVIKAGSQDQASTDSAVSNTFKNIVSGTASLPYIVRYYAEDATDPGTVISNVVYSVQYQ